MQLQLGNFIFKPHLGLTLLVIFFLPTLVGLSYWQWQRGLAKQALISSYQHSQTAPAQNFTGSHSLPLAEFQPLKVSGILDQTHRFYLDNQIYAGRAGFEILVPMQINSDEWVLINLGWLPRHVKRNQLPALLDLPTHSITLEGRADFPSTNYLLLGTYLEVHPENNIIIQAVDYPKLSEFLGVTLLPLVILANPEPNSSFTRDWQPPSTMPPEKHFGYALQWLLLAITLCVLYVIFCIKKIAR